MPKIAKRIKPINLRLSEAEWEALTNLSAITGLTKTKLIMKGLVLLSENLEDIYNIDATQEKFRDLSIVKLD